MTNEEIKQFYREIADVCLKHDISGIAGVWFGGSKSNEFGQLLYWDVTDTHMKAIIKDLSEKFEYWAKHTVGHIKRPLGEIREIHGRGKGEKN